MKNEKSCLYDVMTLDLGTLGNLIATLGECVEDSDFTRPMLASQIHASQHVLGGIYKKLWAIVDRYKFEVDTELFEHSIHEMKWELVLSGQGATGEGGVG